MSPVRPRIRSRIATSRYEQIRNGITPEYYRKVSGRGKTRVVEVEYPFPGSVLKNYISQVDMLNMVAKNPPVQYEFIPVARGGSVTKAAAKKGGGELAYIELPYEWTYPLWTKAEIFPYKGPLDYINLELTIRETAKGSVLTYRGKYASRGLGILGWLIAVSFEKAVIRGMRALSEKIPPQGELVPISPYLGDPDPSELERLRKLLREAHPDQKLIERFIDFFVRAPDKFSGRIKPIQVAKFLGVPERDIIEFLLRATRAGHFNLSWDILCPGCRGDKAHYRHLSELKTEAHCDMCNIHYGADFAANVEVTFRPVEKLRKINYSSYCINSASNTPHIHAQVNAWPDEDLTRIFLFTEQNYRLEIPGQPSLPVRISPEGMKKLRLDLPADMAKYKDGLHLHPETEITVRTTAAFSHPVRFLSDGYRDDALTAAQMTSLQEFRDQFGSEALAPGMQISVENLSFLFTDLKDSTAMYEKMGDTSAFALVRDHFETLTEVIRAFDGAIVKTIGDAVMAVFTSEEKAALAATEILRRIRRDHPAISVKIGIHAGPSLAVNSNDKLDYFGTTVNKAARIQAQAGGQEIAMSAEFESSHGLQPPANFERSPFASELKGIGEANLVRWTYRK